MSLTEALPSELIEDIFEPACLDELGENGALYHTAYSLCLVSRYFYSLAVPLLYRYIFVAGRFKAQLLAQTLLSRPELGLCATHVLISDRHPQIGPESMLGNTDDVIESFPSFAFESPRARQTRLVRQQQMQQWLNARTQALGELRASFKAILGGSLDLRFLREIAG